MTLGLSVALAYDCRVLNPVERAERNRPDCKRAAVQIAEGTMMCISAEIRLRGCQLVAKRNHMRLAASTASPKSVWVQREKWLRG